jgi:hypothetical protein
VVKPHLVTNGQWKIDFQLTGPVAIVALLKDGPEGFDKIAAGTVGRTMADDWMIDQAVATFGTNAVKATTNGFSCDRSLVLAPIRAPADQGDGTLKVSFSSASAGGKVEFNGVEKPVAPIPGTNRTVVAEIALPLKAGEQGLLAFRPGGRVSVSCQWTPKAIPAAATNAPAAK